MFNKSNKKFAILLGALLMCAVLVFAACSTVAPFVPVTPCPSGSTVSDSDNGGIAVRYGDWIYYVNGYQSSALADNSYSDTIRTGAIVRIKAADLEKIIKINEADATSTQKTKAIKMVVAGKAADVTPDALNKSVKDIGGAEVVVPNFYYTGASASDLNGIYIFNDRLYVTTPNTDRDTNGNLLNSQLVLASYKLDGSDKQVHYVFASNAPQLKLSMVGSDLYATFVLDNVLYSLKVGAGQATTIAEKTSSVNFTGDYVWYMCDDAICQYKVGADKASTIVAKSEKEGVSYSIISANREYVYYTITDSESVVSAKYLYYATAEKTDVASYYIPASYYGWRDGIVKVEEVKQSVTTYGIIATKGEGTEQTVILSNKKNDKSITINKLDGDILYYTMDNTAYTIDLSAENAQPQVYAYNLPTSSGWSTPDICGDFVFSLGSGSVSVVKFDPATNKNSASTEITLTVISED